MPYDPEKDKILKKWKCDGTGLVVSINRGGSGPAADRPANPDEKDGTKGAPVKAGRLSQTLWLVT
jgi:hypothetical protein